MFDAYKIGVTLHLTNHVTRGLMLMAADVAKTDAAFVALQNRISSIQSNAIKGGLFLAAGVGMLAMFKGPLDEAKKFELQMARFKALNLGTTIDKQALAFAKSMNVMGSSARDNLKLLTEAQTITGDFGHAKEITPLIARMKFGIETVMSRSGSGDGHGEKSERMFMDLIKTGELRGALKDMGTFKAMLNMATQAYVASGGLVKPGDFLNMIKTGGIAAKTMNDKAFFFSALHTMQEMGGQRTGTSLMSAYQNLVMGRTTQQVAEELAKAGMLDPSMIKYGKTGHITKVLPQALTKASEYQANPFHYMNNVIVPMLQKRGFTDPQIQNELQKYASNRTALSILDTMFRERVNISRSEKQAEKAMNADGLYKLAGGTLQGKQNDLTAKYKTLQMELGNVVLPLAVKAIEKLIPMVKWLSELMERNQGATRLLATAFIALGVGLAIRGTVLLLSAAFGGLGLALNVLTLGQGGGLVAVAAGGLMKLAVAIRAVTSGAGIMALVSGLGALGVKILSLIGPGSMLAAAGLVGYGIGSVINKAIEGTKIDNTIGYMAARVAAFAGNKEAREAVRITSGGKLYQDWSKTTNAAGIKPILTPTLKPAGAISGVNPPGIPSKFGAVDSVAPNNGDKPVNVTTQINLDGRRVAENTTLHQARAASKPQSGRGSFDGTMMPAAPGMNAR